MEKHKNIKQKPPAASPGKHEDTGSFSQKYGTAVKLFTYKEFKKIAGKVSFTLHEWSDILHISERTLQRYAKANSAFPFSVVDRIIQIDKVIKKGVEVFGSQDKFISWLKSEPYMLEQRLSPASLRSIDGINMILTQLGRIEYGLFA